MLVLAKLTNACHERLSSEDERDVGLVKRLKTSIGSKSCNIQLHKGFDKILDTPDRKG